MEDGSFIDSICGWLWDFINDPTAVFTFALFAVTFLLWRSTVGLVRSAEKTAQRQLRAYVFVDSINLTDSGQFTQLAAFRELQENAPVFPGRPGIEIVMKNSGQTPAYKVVHWAAIDVVEVRHEHAIIVPGPVPDGLDAPRSYIAAGSMSPTGRWFQRELTPQEIEDIGNQVRAIYAFGRIEYLDVFGKPHFTTYRLRYTGLYPPLERLTFQYCTTGNETDYE